MQLSELLRSAEQQLVAAGVPDPQIDAQWLLAHCLNCRRIDLQLNATQPVAASVRKTFDGFMARRIRREPLQYILATQDFFGRTFRVTPDVLIPRPETETLIDTMLALFPDRNRPLQILDIGTGSGAIAITLAHEFPQAEIVAIDQSVEALRVAKHNGEQHAVHDRLHLYAADLFPAHRDQTFDCIVSNPPYIRAADWSTLQPEIRDYEPQMALVAGDDGLAIIARIIQDAPAWLKPLGWLICEIGMGQVDAVTALLHAEPYDAVTTHNDLQHIPRVITAQRI